MKRIVRLTESDLVKLVKRVMAEQVSELPTFGSTGDVYAPEDQSLASDIVKKKIKISPKSPNCLNMGQIKNALAGGRIKDVTNEVNQYAATVGKNYGQDKFYYFSGDGQSPTGEAGPYIVNLCTLNLRNYIKS